MTREEWDCWVRKRQAENFRMRQRADQLAYEYLRDLGVREPDQYLPREVIDLGDAQVVEDTPKALPAKTEPVKEDENP